MPTRSFQRSFSGGEITPELYGRIDLTKRQEGLALCRNFITLPHGPAVNRPGTEYVSTVKNSANFTRLIPFSYNNVQTFAIEVGAGYFRWHTQASTLGYTTPAAWSSSTAYNQGDMASSGGVTYYCVLANTNQAVTNTTYWYAMPANIYEIPNSYAAADLAGIHYVQSADVLTLVHQNYPPMELRRYGATNWQFTAPSFTPPANPITAVTATTTVKTTGTPVTQTYCVTCVATLGLQESIASMTASCSNDLTQSGNSNTITWTDPSSAGTNIRYYVYKLANGLYGYIGEASGTSFTDNNITANVAQTPPIADPNAAFNSAGNYPAAVSYYQQRRWFGGTANSPQNLWATRSGTESNMSYMIPVQADNRISVKIAAREASSIQHIVPAAQLIMLTASCEWRCSAPSNGDVITPSTISIAPQSYIGANSVTPVVVNNIILYAAARGGHVRELSYSWQAASYVSNDISLMAPHLFDYNQVLDMCYARGPIPVLWCISSTGNLLGMTYVPEQQVSAWHHHDTVNGVFEACCVITENNEDMLYVIVNRTFNGSTVRCVERLHTRNYAAVANAFYVDCGATFTSGTATNTVTGLTWLNGQTVNILADGAVQPQQVVSGGTITLPNGLTANTITVGLPITAQLETLPAALQIDAAAGQGRMKNVNKVWIRVYRSSGISAGPDFNHLTQLEQRTVENYGSPPNLVSDEVEMVLTPGWASSGQVCIQQTDPLPLDVTSITMELELGA